MRHRPKCVWNSLPSWSLFILLIDFHLSCNVNVPHRLHLILPLDPKLGHVIQLPLFLYITFNFYALIYIQIFLGMSSFSVLKVGIKLPTPWSWKKGFDVYF